MNKTDELIMRSILNMDSNANVILSREQYKKLFDEIDGLRFKLDVAIDTLDIACRCIENRKARENIQRKMDEIDSCPM